MNPIKKPILLLLACCFYFFSIKAQNTIPATGGNAAGSGGSVSFTTGQVVYTVLTGSSGALSQGVQQPYEISVPTALEEASDISLIFSVYPNPAADYLILKTGEYEKGNLSYWLYNVGGTLIGTKNVLSSETFINMNGQTAGIYFLKITSGNKEIKTFKIIKH